MYLSQGYKTATIVRIEPSTSRSYGISYLKRKVIYIFEKCVLSRIETLKIDKLVKLFFNMHFQDV